METSQLPWSPGEWSALHAGRGVSNAGPARSDSLTSPLGGPQALPWMYTESRSAGIAG